MIDLSEEQLNFINNVLHRRIPRVAVWAFGSRVNRTSGKHSDLDIVIVAKNLIDSKTIALLKEDFSESNLPFRIDVIEWSRISEEFRKVIEKNYIVLQKGTVGDVVKRSK